VHIFPCDFADPGCERTLASYARRRPALRGFWANLEEGFRLFVRDARPPGISVDAAGRYLFDAPR